jgi:hypothetical protein
MASRTGNVLKIPSELPFARGFEAVASAVAKADGHWHRECDDNPRDGIVEAVTRIEALRADGFAFARQQDRTGTIPARSTSARRVQQQSRNRPGGNNRATMSASIELSRTSHIDVATRAGERFCGCSNRNDQSRMQEDQISGVSRFGNPIWRIPPQSPPFSGDSNPQSGNSDVKNLRTLSLQIPGINPASSTEEPVDATHWHHRLRPPA